MTQTKLMPYWRRFDLKELHSLPTLAVGQTCDLKVDSGRTRVWLCRATREDGAPYNNMVSVETYCKGNWTLTDTYEAKP